MGVKFIGKLLILAAVCALMAFGFLFYFGFEEQAWYWGAIAFFVILGLVISRITHKSINASNSAFFRGTMGAIGIRMLVSIVLLAIYLIVSDLKSTPFVVFYLILYLLFTIFEISQLVVKLRPEKNSKLDNTTS